MAGKLFCFFWGGGGVDHKKNLGGGQWKIMCFLGGVKY